MALLDLNHTELTTIVLALSNVKMGLIASGKANKTPAFDALAAKINLALIEEQKDIDFEKRRNAIMQ